MKKRGEFVRVQSGFRAHQGVVSAEARRREPADTGPARAGFTTSKKVGDAVARNRARRRLREAARALLGELGLAGVDYVFVGKPATAVCPYPSLLDDMRSALIRLRASLEAGGDPPPRPNRNRPRGKQDKPKP